MISCCYNINWDAISAISNILMALIAFGSLGFSFYLLNREKRLREEDLRARVDCSIIKHFNAYYLLVENVGKETAYKVNIQVKGKIIDCSLYKQVKDIFEELKEKDLIIKSGDKKYFFLCPDKLEKDVQFPWRKDEKLDDINLWVAEHEQNEISIHVKYNKKYCLSHKFSIINFDFAGSTKILSPIEQISGVISDMDSFTLESIKDSLISISSSIDNLNNRYE